MLIPVRQQKEVTMYKQLLLFEEPRPAWIDRLWRTMDRQKQQEIVDILAEVARCTIAHPKGPDTSEVTHESL
jgi:hypothetical protein